MSKPERPSFAPNAVWDRDRGRWVVRAKEPVYKCSICGHRTDDPPEHTWSETAAHFFRELIGGEKMELIPLGNDGRKK